MMLLCAATLNFTGLSSVGGDHDDCGGDGDGSDDGGGDVHNDGGDEDDGCGGEDHYKNRPGHACGLPIAKTEDGKMMKITNNIYYNHHYDNIRPGHACGLTTIPSPGLLLRVMQRLQV